MAIQDCENLWRYEIALLFSSYKFVIAIASFFSNFKTIA
jgi:hypothetical protein